MIRCKEGRGRERKSIEGEDSIRRRRVSRERERYVHYLKFLGVVEAIMSLLRHPSASFLIIMLNSFNECQ